MRAARGQWQCGLILALSLGAAIGSGAASTARAGEGTSTLLDRYLSGLQTLRTDFSQTVTDAHAVRTEQGGGTLLVARPDRFRWDYQPHADSAQSAPSSAGAPAPPAEAPSGQLLIADGQNVWFFDRELAQVTVKPIDAALSSTPIMLLSGSPEQLHSSFQISAAGSHDGLDWVAVKPRGSEGDFSSAELGFKADRLSRMIVHDHLGQSVQLDFSRSERNAALPPAAFAFTPPSGVDVIGTPRPAGATHGAP